MTHNNEALVEKVLQAQMMSMKGREGLLRYSMPPKSLAEPKVPLTVPEPRTAERKA